ncbi:MAG: phage portal protein, partial [Bacteroidia bacterium]|nr:phage portal protein [Bacteroidia bacterium]
MMGIIGNLEQRMALGATGALSDSWYLPGGAFYGGVGGGKTKSGSQVSEFNAMQLDIVWCCIKILSEDIASLPLHLYRRLPNGGKERAFDHPLYSILHDSPNPEMTAMSFRESYASHILSWGNGYAEKVYGRNKISKNTIEQLWPITPNRVTVKRNKGEITKLPLRSLYYHISMSGTGLQDVDLSRENIFHTPGLGFDGVIGYSPIAYFRESIGLGKTYKEYAELYFGNGTHPSAIVTHPNQVKDMKVMRKALADVYSGLGNAHKLMLLEDNMQFQKVGIPNDEAQFIESQKLTNVDIGTRIYRLFPQQYGEYDKSSTYASAEQFSIDYVTKTLRAWLVRLEQSYNMQLLTPEEQVSLFWEHNVEGLLRGDAASRGDFYQKLFAVGGITPNQIAEIENWNPIGPEGDRRFIPLNMIPLDNADDIQRKQANVAENQSLYR